MTATLDTQTNRTGAQTSADVSADELVARAAALRPLICEHAAQTEQQRRVAQECIDAIEAADLYRIAKPARYGGLEKDFRTFMRVSAELGKADGSTAWVSTLMNVTSWVVGLYPEQAQQEVWGEDINARVCGVLAPSATSRAVEGGQVITGSWGFASGCLHSQWAGVGFPVVNEAGEPVDQAMALIPMDELSIEDTWYVAGMRGTGSNTLVANEVFVPNHRILSLPRAIVGDYGTEHKDEALYRSALVPVLALVLVGPQVGLAKQAFDLVEASLAKGRGISYTFYDKSSLAPTTQLQMAEAAQLIDTAEMHMMRAAADIDAAAESGEYLDFKTRARVRADVSTVVRRCREAVDILINVNGAGSFAEANPLQRVWRDIETGGRHAVVNPEIGLELYGRALLGVEEQITALI